MFSSFCRISVGDMLNPRWIAPPRVWFLIYPPGKPKRAVTVRGIG